MTLNLPDIENPSHRIVGEHKSYQSPLSEMNLSQIKKEERKLLSIEELLHTPFPFGKCKNLPVGVVCLKSYYLAALYDKNAYWQVHPLRELLVASGVLIENGRKLNPVFYVLCQEIVNKFTKNSADTMMIPRTNLEPQNALPEERSSCVLCLEHFPLSAGVRYSWMPCGHSNLCQNCYFSKQLELRQITHCPTCRMRLSVIQPLKQMFV